MTFNVMEHELVPEHRLLPEEEAEKVLKELGVDREQLPKIAKSDPVISFLEKSAGETLGEGRIIQVTRRSHTAGMFVAYRVVIRG